MTDLRPSPRDRAAGEYLRGDGIEIGALQKPLKVPPGARVRYLDRLSVPELRIQYPELNSEALVPVDIVDDGETMAKVASGSQDFVIANHFLEHCESPLLALGSMLRVLRPGGVVFLAIPDKRLSFDAKRPVTSYEHVLRDFTEGPAWSRRAHFEEYARLVEGVQGEDRVRARARELMEMNYSIHFHVWSQPEMVELLLRAREREPFEIELMNRNEDEVIFVLRKGAPAPATR